MRIISCENPQRIFNRYINQALYVPCKKCNTCLDTYALQWQQRLSDESRQHKYTIFFTLTYNENNVPYYSHLTSDAYPALDILASNRHTAMLDVSRLNDAYVNSRETIPHVCKKDIQLFLKRLRRYSEIHVNKIYSKYEKTYKEDSKIRYFICSEYGPSTYRSHYHGLLFFDNREIAESIGILIRKAWQLGFSSFSFAGPNRIKYCAKYVSCAPNLPQIYENKNLKPFFLSSRKPAIGTYISSKEEVQKLILEQPITRSYYNGKEYVDAPHLRSVEDRFYPKFKGFSQITVADRIKLLRRCLTMSTEAIESATENQTNYVYQSRLLPYLYGQRRSDSSAIIYYNRDNLLQLRSIATRIYNYSKMIGISFEDYIVNIDLYYKKKKIHELKQQYEFQADYLYKRPNELQQMIHYYPVFRDSIFSKKYGELTKAELIQLDTFNIHIGSFNQGRCVSSELKKMRDKLVYTKCLDYVEMKSIHKKICHDNLKTKHIRDIIDENSYKVLGKNPYKGYYKHI